MRTAARTTGIACIALLASLACAAEPSKHTEKLLLQPPDGFVVGYQLGNITEWVRPPETVQNWTELVTLTVYKVGRPITPAQFLGGIAERWLQACPETKEPRLFTGTTNGYAVTMMLLSCPLLKATGKAETAGFRAILGGESLYVVQQAWRSVPSPDQFAASTRFLGSVGLCDSIQPGHACPDAGPAPASAPAKH